ncbi:Retrovirus-related Pol polyprotein from transposon 17.6, partial [Mucuna pruriens]
MDYRAINNIIARYRHPIPCLDDLLDELHDAKLFSKIDLKADTIKFGKRDEWKMTFKTNLIDKCMVMYFDDILIYSTCLDDHLLHVLNVLEILRKETLFANLDKCVFYTPKVTFLDFVVGSHGVKVDEEKVKAIKDWPTPKIVGEVRSFHGFTSFYRKFVKDFNTFAAPLNETVKKNVGFKWEESQERTFQTLKEKAQSSSNSCEFVIHSNHEALKNLRWKSKLNRRHAKWFPYVIKHKQDRMNVVADALLRRHALIAIFETKMLGLDCTKQLHYGFLFKGKKLSVPVSSIRQLLVREAHEGGLMGHFEDLKTLDIFNEHFY